MTSGRAIESIAVVDRPKESMILLGVRFHRVTRQETVACLSDYFGKAQARKVYIVNAHTLNVAWSDERFREILNASDLLLNDGTGVQIASRLVGRPFPDNLVGTDLVPELCQRAAKHHVGVFLLGGDSGVAEAAGKTLRQIIPDLVISGTHAGYFPESAEARIARVVNESGAGILLVAMGNPIQEKWIHRNAPRLKCDVCMGVGGLFDHLSGRLRRAPLWMRRCGVEWVHILISQPHKWRRYLVGNPLFLARALADRLGGGR